MDYISKLRQLIGHRPIIWVGAAALVYNAQGELMFMLRPDNGCWGIPGGGMEPGESLEDTARRETREEVGLEVGELRLMGVFSGQELFYEYPNGDQVYIVTVVYETHDYKGALRRKLDEAAEIKFFSLDALPDKISPPIRPIIAQLTNRAARFQSPRKRIYEQRAETSRFIDAEIGQDGALTLIGQDVGKAPHEFFGDGDYEFWVTLSAAQKDAVLLALLEKLYAGSPAAVDQFRDLLQSQGIDFKFNTWA